MLYTSIWLTLHHLSADCYCLHVIIIYAQADSKHWVLHSSRIVLPLSGMALVCQPLLNICYDSEGRNVFSFNCSCKYSCVTMHTTIQGKHNMNLMQFKIVFERTREKWIGLIQCWSVYAVLWFRIDPVPNYNNISMHLYPSISWEK